MIINFISEISKILHSEHPFMQVLNDIFYGMSYIWHYKIFETDDKQPIAISNIIIGLSLFIIGLRFSKYLSIQVRNKIFRTIKVEKSVANSLERICYYLFILLITIFVLDITNVPLTAFTVVGTTLALGVGLGSQNIVNNFISGLIIMVERPIKLGDIIEIKDIIGKVINIGARCICLRTDNNINILIPNSYILQDSIINWTLDDTTLKTSFSLHVDRNANLQKIDDIIYYALHNHPKILKNPTPHILVREITKEGFKIEVEFWINLESSHNSKYIINDINREIDPQFKNNKVTLVEKDKSEKEKNESSEK